MGFPGYFLIVWDIVRFCREQRHPLPGARVGGELGGVFRAGHHQRSTRCSGICCSNGSWPRPATATRTSTWTSSPTVARRPSSTSTKRYDRLHTAQVANVITYRARSAVREMAKALGYAPGQQDAWSKQIDRWGPFESTKDDLGPDVPKDVLEFAAQVEDFPRHLGIHSGGMVICDRPVSRWCRSSGRGWPSRSVLQWDKDDCAAVGLVKFDLLGLGMLSALHYLIDLVARVRGRGSRPRPSRSGRQARLRHALRGRRGRRVPGGVAGPRWRRCPGCSPEEFYDLVVEVALIRPGPIQGGSVHPYIRRRNGTEVVTIGHRCWTRR